MLAIVQARMSSRRLPGKVLRPLSGSTILARIHSRLRLCERLDSIVVATTMSKDDDPIVEFCRNSGITYYRGPLDDVASRLLDCAKSLGKTAFLRISGDSPLIDPLLVDQAIKCFDASQYDLVTNVQIRTFPKGQSVEIISTEALNKVIVNFNDYDREHVTKYFYDHHLDFNIFNITNKAPLGDIQLSIDTLEDFKAVEYILSLIGNDFTWQQAAALRLQYEQ